MKFALAIVAAASAATTTAATGTASAGTAVATTGATNTTVAACCPFRSNAAGVTANTMYCIKTAKANAVAYATFDGNTTPIFQNKGTNASCKPNTASSGAKTLVASAAAVAAVATTLF